MSFATLLSYLITLSSIVMFPVVIANQGFFPGNCSYDALSRNNTYSINFSTVLYSIKDLANQVASNDTNIHKLQSSSFGEGDKYFGTKVINIATNNLSNNFTRVYEMVRCSSNMSVESCNRCLMSMINKLSKGCTRRLGKRVANRNCFIRYETHPFYNFTAMESSLPPLFTTPLMASNTASHRLGKITLLAIIAITIPTSILVGLSTFGIGLFIWKVNQKKKWTLLTSDGDDDFDAVESLQYSLDALKGATQNFSDYNKVGQGGFGSVYKGVLQNGQEIAVKKLHKSTIHVDEEFKNEVAVLAELQHRNLVRLFGFCLVEAERLLVFEYVPNSTLDKLLFDTRVRLNWMTRFKIINGIAQGLLYLHEESRHKIVHRDLKPGNILLDKEMNPKIADFGMARFYGIKLDYEVPSNAKRLMANSGIDPTHQSTQTGGGTFGYMAPEITRRGHFSVKTDVYSYGVIILEIISGQRNTRFHLSGLAEDLLSYCWMQWKAGNPLALIDENLVSENETSNQVMKEQILMCIHIGLLCIQKDRKKRPTIKMIVQKYSNICENFKRWANECK